MILARSVSMVMCQEIEHASKQGRIFRNLDWVLCDADVP